MYRSLNSVGEIQSGNAWKDMKKSLSFHGRIGSTSLVGGGENFKGKDDKGKGGGSLPCCLVHGRNLEFDETPGKGKKGKGGKGKGKKKGKGRGKGWMGWLKSS